MENEFGNVPPAPEGERVGFCQDCGRPLTRETVRTVGSGVFCEPCLEIRLAATGAAAGSATGAGAASATPPVPPGTLPVGTFPPLGGANPNPATAALLGFIPGVGAIYNGQFAKGIAHIVIFVLLSSLGHSSDFFGLLAFLWCCYQSYEAYHTAKARREGMPLPDPFGLNDIGERIGMGKGWPGAVNPNAPNGQPPPAYPGWTGYVPQPPVVPPAPPVSSPEAAWGSTPVQPYAAPYTQPAAYVPTPEGAPVPPAASWTTNAYVPPVTPVRAQKRFPTGAIWLIALGTLFLLFNVEPDWRFGITVERVAPFLLIALAVWIFVRRMLASGGLAPAAGEGEAFLPRVVCWMRAPIVLCTVGVLLALQTFAENLPMHRTWPVIVIVLGAVLLLERSMGARAYLAQPATSRPDAGTDGKGF